MAGHAGTARFGEYSDDHNGKPDVHGQNKVMTTSDEITYTEQHYLYNPAEMGRDVSTPPGQAPGKYYIHLPQQYDAPSNHDGLSGGDVHLTVLDERKVLENTIYSTKIECADINGYRAPFQSSERSA